MFPTALALVALLSTAFAQRPLRSVGLTVGDLGNPFFVQIAKGAEAKARQLGAPDVKFSAVSSNYDLNLQTNQIEDFIAAKVDLIVLGAADSKGIAPAVRKARAANIVVIAVDVTADGGVNGTVLSDNVQAGNIVARYLVEKLGGKGTVAIIDGPPVSAVVDRVKGAKEAFAEAPGIKVVATQNGGGNRTGGLNVATDILTAQPTLDAIFAINDPSALGAVLAIRQARREKVWVVGVDGAPDSERALKDGKSALIATAAQDPFTMAGKAVEVGVEVLNGNKLESETVLIPVALVTRDNVASYKGWTAK